MNRKMQKTISLSFSSEQLSVINAALMLAPYGQVAPVITEINKQIQEQLAATSQGEANVN